MGTVTDIRNVLKERARSQISPPDSEVVELYPPESVPSLLREVSEPLRECDPLSSIEKRVVEIHGVMSRLLNSEYEKDGYVEGNYVIAVRIDHTRERRWYKLGVEKRTVITVDWREKDFVHGIYNFYVKENGIMVKSKLDENHPILGKIRDLSASLSLPLDVLAHTLTLTYNLLAKKYQRDE